MFTMEKSADELKWESERGIVIELAKVSDYQELRQVVHEYFYPEEPIQKSLEIGTGPGIFDPVWKWLSDCYLIKDPLKKSQTTPGCLVAKCATTGKILGARIGEVLDKNSLQPDIRFEAIKDWPPLVPVSRRLRKLACWQAMESKHQFGHDNIFKHPETAASDRIYLDCLVCVNKEARGKGLGGELVRRGHRLAEKAKCSHTYVMATTTGSQKIFQRLGYKVLLEFNYADYQKDSKGRPFLTDTLKHKSFQIVTLEH